MVDQEMGDGMQCITHPYTKNPGGICALCLQEKLGKLVTSSFPLPKPNHLSSSSPPPSTTSLALSLSSQTSGRNSTTNNSHNLPFLLAKKKKSMLSASSSSVSSSSSSTPSSNLIYKRSKSTAAAYGEGFGQRKRSGFWSFLHLYSSKHQINTTTKKVENFSHLRRNQKTESSSNRVGPGGSIDVIVEAKEEEEEEDKSSPTNKVVTETPTNSVGGGSSFGRKVMRSRSVGCGSRSFSGDFFERISNGFGDCAVRRIGSQRESTKVISNGGEGGEDAMSDMVKCGGIFGGFMIMTPSSSSSSGDHHHNHHHKIGSKSWGWAFASPMRAKTTTHRDRTITESTSDKNTTPNLDSIPSLLTLRS